MTETPIQIRLVIDGDRLPLAVVFAGVAAERDEIATEPPVDISARARSWTLAATEACPMFETGQGARTDLGTAHPEAPARTRERLAEMFAVGQNATQQARHLLAHEPVAAEARSRR